MRCQQHPTTKLIAFASLLSAVGFVACGDPEQPPPGAAYDLSIRNGNGCKAPTDSWLGPDQNPFYNTQGLEFGDIHLTHSDVSCRVVNNGGVFNFSGSVRYKSSTPGSLDFALTQGTVAEGQTTGSARINASHSLEFGGISGSCDVTVLDIASGGVWAEFNCPDARADSTPGDASCALVGSFVFDDCDR